MLGFKLSRYILPVIGFTFLFVSSLRSEIVFDNIQTNFNGMYYPDTIEYGDELQLAGSANILNQFQFEYFGEFGFEISPSVKVRIYANDGTMVTDAGKFSQPNSLLYESDSLKIYPGYNIITLRKLSIPVTNTFTWTVQWEGLAGSFSNRAGIMFYNPPSIGNSYNDFWGKFPDGWYPMNFGGIPVANFAARAWATPDPKVSILSVTNLANGTRHIKFSGPHYSSLSLESSVNQTDWVSIASFVMTNETSEFFDSSPKGADNTEYRIRQLSQPLLLIRDTKLTGEGQFLMNFMCTPLKNFSIDAAMDLVRWTPMVTNFSSSVSGVITDTRAINFTRRYYRAYLLPDIAVFLYVNTLFSSEGTILNASGPPGMDCIFQISSDFKSWTPLVTNTFCYSGGLTTYIDPPKTNSQPRFYRVESLPNNEP